MRALIFNTFRSLCGLGLMILLPCSVNTLYADTESGAEKPLLEKFDKGYINWKSGEYVANVTAPVPAIYRGKPVNQAMGKELALRVSRSLADSVFLQIVANTRVDAKQRLSNLVKTDAQVKLTGNIRGKQLVNQSWFNKDNRLWIKARYRIPMRGVNGVISNVYNQVIQATPKNQAHSMKPVSSPDAENTVIYIDARRTELQPALFPDILDQEHNRLLDPAGAGKGYVSEKGVVEYVVIEPHQPISKIIRSKKAIVLSVYQPTLLDRLITPVIAEESVTPVRKRKKRKAIKATEAEGLLKANIIVSKADAVKIRQAQAAGELGNHPRIIVITDGTIGGTEGHLNPRYFKRYFTSYPTHKSISTNFSEPKLLSANQIASSND